MMFRNTSSLRFRGESKKVPTVIADLPQTKEKQKLQRELVNFWSKIENTILRPITSPSAPAEEFKKSSSLSTFGISSVTAAASHLASAATGSSLVSLMVAMFMPAAASAASGNYSFSTGQAPGGIDRCKPFLSYQCLQGYVTQNNIAALSEKVIAALEKQGVEIDKATPAMINHATVRVILDEFKTASSTVIATWQRTVTDANPSDPADSGYGTALRRCFDGGKMKAVLMQALGIQADGSSAMLEKMTKSLDTSAPVSSCPLTSQPWQKLIVQGTIFANSGLTTDSCFAAQNEFMSQLMNNCETFDTQVNGTLLGLGIALAVAGAACIAAVVAYKCCKDRCESNAHMQRLR